MPHYKHSAIVRQYLGNPLVKVAPLMGEKNDT